MRRTLPLICSSILVILLVAAAGQVAGRTHSAKAQPLISGPGFHCVSWAVVNSPNVSGESNSLDGVSALSDTDVWAVGDSTIPGTEQSLIEHFNGIGWSIVPSPAPTPLTSQLFGVAALSSDNVWAVGTYGNAGQYSQPLIIHWNGTSWSNVTNPTFAFGGQLSAIAAVSANDIWVAGDASPSQDTNVGLLEHWDGALWAIVPSPTPPDSLYGPALTALATVASNDVWGVGSYQNQASISQTLTMHWDGNTWSIVSTPNSPLATAGDSLSGVAAPATNDVWAVGSYASDPNNGYVQSFMEHWNGSAWSIIANPNPGVSTMLFGASAVPGTQSVWAAGEYYNVTTQVWHPLTERWDGRTWSIISTPTSSTAVTSGVSAISALGPNDAWTVGGFSVPANIPNIHTGIPGYHSTTPTRFTTSLGSELWPTHTLGTPGGYGAAFIGDSLTEHYASRSTPTGACPL